MILHEKIECVENFSYLGRMLCRSNNNWPTVCRNVRKARRVWSRLGKLLRREGEDPQVAVLLFGVDTWFLLASMFRNL